MLLYAVGVPAFAYFSLKRIFSKRGVGDTSINLKNKLQYGFLFDGFVQKCYYWEVMIMLRKVAVVFSLVFLSPQGVKVQTASCLCVIGFFLILTSAKLPYSNKQLNMNEVSSLLISVFTMYFGMLLYGTASSKGVRVLFTMGIIVLNISWLSYMFFSLFGSVLLKIWNVLGCSLYSAACAKKCRKTFGGCFGILLEIPSVDMSLDEMPLEEDDDGDVEITRNPLTEQTREFRNESVFNSKDRNRSESIPPPKYKPEDRNRGESFPPPPSEP